MRAALAVTVALVANVAHAEPALDAGVRDALIASTSIFCTTTLGDELEEVVTIRSRLTRARMTQEGLRAEHERIEALWAAATTKHQVALAALTLPPVELRHPDLALAATLAASVALHGKERCPTWKASTAAVLEFWQGMWRGVCR